jgi:signal transduction histidine kinase
MKLDDVADAIIEVDTATRIVAVNSAASDLLGDDLIGRTIAECLSPRALSGGHLWEDGQLPPSARLGRVRRMPENSVVVRGRQGDVTVRATGTYVRDADGSLKGLVLSVRLPARRAHEAVSGIEIVSTVSHELRSPLTSVKGYTSLLLNRWERLKDEQKTMMLEQVNHDADRVTRLITELLDISRLELGRLALRRQLVDLEKVILSVIEKVALDQPELDASVDVADDVPRVYADPDKVEQVVTNLVENACKYATPRGLRISVVVEHGDRIAVSVADLGEGIPTEDLVHVFRKFFRRDLSKPTGTGLGLWISRGLVEAHGGRLTASSVVGEGSTFTFTLPLIDVDELLG